jgi:hypothetical protein
MTWAKALVNQHCGEALDAGEPERVIIRAVSVFKCMKESIAGMVGCKQLRKVLAVWFGNGV